MNTLIQMSIKNRIKILNCPIDCISMDETLLLISQAIAQRKPIHHVVVNAAKLVNAQNDNALMEAIVDCDIINADGQSVVWASKFLKKPLPERVAGIDLMEKLIVMASEKNFKIFFLGAEGKVLNKVIEKCSINYGDKIIAGFHDGYFSELEEQLVAQKIADSSADILFVAMTSPKKEIFLNKFKKIINIPFIMGVGGSFDVFAGKVKRAPKWMQAYGLEWFFRVWQEPRRLWKRYLITNSKFIYLLLKEKLARKNQ